MGLIDNMRLVL